MKTLYLTGQSKVMSINFHKRPYELSTWVDLVITDNQVIKVIKIDAILLQKG